MITVTVGTNMNRSKVVVDPNTTLRSVLKEQNVDFSRGAIHLDGVTLKPGELDKTFTQMGVSGDCYLISVVKMDNAVAA